MHCTNELFGRGFGILCIFCLLLWFLLFESIIAAAFLNEIVSAYRDYQPASPSTCTHAFVVHILFVHRAVFPTHFIALFSIATVWWNRKRVASRSSCSLSVVECVCTRLCSYAFYVFVVAVTFTSFFHFLAWFLFIILYFTGWLAGSCGLLLSLPTCFIIFNSNEYSAGIAVRLICFTVRSFIRPLARWLARTNVCSFVLASDLASFFIIIIIFIKKSGYSNNNGRSSHDYSKRIREYIVRIACFYRQFISYNACLE